MALCSVCAAEDESPGLSVHAGLLMMSLEPLELCDHHLARRDQHVAVLVRNGARLESLGEARIGSSFFGRIARGSNDQTVNHFAGVLDAIRWDAAAMSVAQKEAGGLGKLSRICGLGAASPQKEKQSERGE
jgi:hypothetical protein